MAENRCVDTSIRERVESARLYLEFQDLSSLHNLSAHKHHQGRGCYATLQKLSLLQLPFSDDDHMRNFVCFSFSNFGT